MSFYMEMITSVGTRFELKQLTIPFILHLHISSSFLLLLLQPLVECIIFLHHIIQLFDNLRKCDQEFIQR